MKKYFILLISALLCYNFTFAQDITNISTRVKTELINKKFLIKNENLTNQVFKTKIRKDINLRKLKKNLITKINKKSKTDKLLNFKAKEYIKNFDTLSETNLVEWTNILNQNTTANIEYIANTNKYKIIAEVRLINNSYDIIKLKNNLDVLKQLGYDSVLVRFDCSEDIIVLKNLVKDIKNNGFNVFITFIGDDYNTKNWSVFINPTNIENYFKELSPEAIGVFLCWRRGTSIKRYVIPMEYYNYICNISRKYNKNILIYGEVFYGSLEPQQQQEAKLYNNIPENITGILIHNYGYRNSNRAYIINKLIKNNISNYNKLNIIGIVNGTAIIQKNIKTEYKYKKYIEKSFNKLNCSTVTFLRNGFDIRFIRERKLNISDNILENDLTTWEIK